MKNNVLKLLKFCLYSAIFFDLKLYASNNFELVVQTYHSSSVKCVAFSPDEKIVASGSYDNTIKLWTLDGRLLRTLSGHSDRVHDIAFSPDGKTIASVAIDGTTRLWNVEDGKLIKTFQRIPGGRYRIDCVAFSPDGKKIASAFYQGVIELWSIEENKVIKNFEYPSNPLRVIFSPDGKKIASGFRNGEIKIWSIQGELINTLEHPVLEKHGNITYSIAFSPDGKILISGTNTGDVKLWSIDGKLLNTLEHPGQIYSVAFSPDGETIYTATDSNIKLWNKQGKLIKTAEFTEFTPAISARLSPSCKFLGIASAYSGYNRIFLWDLQNMSFIDAFEMLDRWRPGHQDGRWNHNILGFSPDGQTFASTSVEGYIKLWNLNGKLLSIFKKDSGQSIINMVSPNIQPANKKFCVDCIKFSPDGKTIASAW